jgi:hypothetical protein
VADAAFRAAVAIAIVLAVELAASLACRAAVASVNTFSLSFVDAIHA